jgi:YjbR
VRGHSNAPAELLEQVRAICLGLPEVHEERAWVGTRWCIRKHTFAHIVPITDAWPPAYVKAAGTPGPTNVLTFRTPEPEFYEEGRAGDRYFWPGWFPNLVGLFLDDDIDWSEVAELLEDSYRLLAPRRLVEQLSTGHISRGWRYESAVVTDGSDASRLVSQWISRASKRV